MEVGGWVSRVLALRIPVVVHVEQGANECYAGMVFCSTRDFNGFVRALALAHIPCVFFQKYYE